MEQKNGVRVEMIEELEIYGEGLFRCSVCTNIQDLDRIEELVNIKRPTGVDRPWKIIFEPFAKGNPLTEKSGCPCEKHPQTHKHYLMEC